MDFRLITFESDLVKGAATLAQRWAASMRRTVALPVMLILMAICPSCGSSKKGNQTMKIRQVMIFVDDIHEARRFYCDTIGLEIEQDLSDILGMIIIKHDGCLLTIHGGHTKQPYAEGRKVSVAFGVDDIKGEVKRLKELGVQMVGEIEETPVHWFQAFLDPAGNMIEIGQYK